MSEQKSTFQVQDLLIPVWFMTIVSSVLLHWILQHSVG